VEGVLVLEVPATLYTVFVILIELELTLVKPVHEAIIAKFPLVKILIPLNLAMPAEAKAELAPYKFPVGLKAKLTV